MSGQEQKQGQTSSETAVVPAEAATAPAVVDEQPWQPDFGGVSWEEARKGQAPKEVANADEAILYDRFTSLFSIVNMPNDRWKPVTPLFKPE